MDSKLINEWGGGPAKMDAKVGTKFTFWGGDIYGKNIKVVENKELAQDWFQAGWKKPSKVTFKLTSRGGTTEVALIHKNVPDEDTENIDMGWKDYYLGPMKDYLENK